MKAGPFSWKTFLDRHRHRILDFAKPMTLDLTQTDINQVILRCTELLRSSDVRIQGPLDEPVFLFAVHTHNA